MYLISLSLQLWGNGALIFNTRMPQSAFAWSVSPDSLSPVDVLSATQQHPYEEHLL